MGGLRDEAEIGAIAEYIAPPGQISRLSARVEETVFILDESDKLGQTFGAIHRRCSRCSIRSRQRSAIIIIDDR